MVTSDPRNDNIGIVDRFFSFLVYLLARVALPLRYRIRVSGLSDVAGKGTTGIVFLPNHPALIDPVIMMMLLHRRFKPKALGDRDQVDRFFIRRVAKSVGVRTIPDMVKHGPVGRERIHEMLKESIEGLRRGENMLLYPAGHNLPQIDRRPSRQQFGRDDPSRSAGRARGAGANARIMGQQFQLGHRRTAQRRQNAEERALEVAC